MISGDYGPLGQAIHAADTAKAQLDKLAGQAADGLVSDSYAGLGAAAQTSVDLQPQITQLATQQSAIGAVTARLSVTQSALNQIESIASNFNAKLAGLNGVTPTQTDSVAVSARSALRQVANLLDASEGGTYVFAGTDSATPPVPNPDAITGSAFYTQIGAAVAGLATNGAAATAASTLAVAASNAPGTTPFAGSGAAPTLDLGPGGTVQVGVLASANTLAVSGGSSTTGSYVRDIMRGLATLSNLSSSQATAPGFTALVQDTQASLSGAIGALGIEGGALGDIQSSLQTMQARAAATSTTLSAQVSSVQNVDMTKTLSELSQVQTQLSASYKLVSEMNKLSLVDFL